MRRLKIIILLVLLFLCDSAVLFGGNKEKITFNMSPTGYPPYMIYNENKNPSGIMYEVLKKVNLHTNVCIKFGQGRSAKQ